MGVGGYYYGYLDYFQKIQIKNLWKSRFCQLNIKKCKKKKVYQYWFPTVKIYLYCLRIKKRRNNLFKQIQLIIHSPNVK